MNSQFDRQKSTLWISILFSVLLIATIFSVGFMYYQDYPKETLYFICILSTLGITGYLSFYAWQHRDIRSALPFMLMEIGECLLALFEIFSMISSTDTQALFWFNLRFLLTATNTCGHKIIDGLDAGHPDDHASAVVEQSLARTLGKTRSRFPAHRSVLACRNQCTYSGRVVYGAYVL